MNSDNRDYIPENAGGPISGDAVNENDTAAEMNENNTAAAVTENNAAAADSMPADGEAARSDADAAEKKAAKKNAKKKEKKTAQSSKKSLNILYFFTEALRSAWRNRVMSIASVLVLASCLVILGAFAILVININLNLERLGLLNEIVVFVDYDLEQSQVDDICADIQALDNVAFVEYVSKADGLSEMKETYAGYEDLFDELEQAGDNPLADSFRITYKDNSKVYELESALHAIPGVNRVNNRLDYAVKVENFKHGMSIIFAWFLVLLFAVSLFVIFNTIKLAVHGRRAEISIMRYIGATKGFIITPFVIEGVLIGLLAGVGAWAIDSAVYRYLIGAAAEGMQMIELRPAADFDIIMLVSFIAIGIVTGVAASLLSLHRNLNN